MVIVMKATVFGVGINDADYKVTKKINGKQYSCPVYSTWRNMLKRCYCEKYHQTRPTYIGCTVCDEWLTFSNFKAWMEKQDWHGKHLDKDIKVKGNKVYSKDTCAFVNDITNSFICDAEAIRGDCRLGVYLYKRHKKFAAVCGNPFTKQRDFLGYFEKEIDAHNAYLKQKRRHARKIADLESDPDIKASLLSMY